MPITRLFGLMLIVFSVLSIPLVEFSTAGSKRVETQGNKLSNTAWIEACLDKYKTSRAQEKNCVNGLSKKCIEAPDNNHTIGYYQCLERETKAWDKLLNQYYKQARAGATKKFRQALRDAQRAWIKFRDAECALPYAASEGTGAGLSAAQCVLDQTANRAIRLKRY